MAKKIRKKNPHHRYIDTSFGGIDSKYYAVPVGEGIEMLKEDIKDIAIDSKESVEDLVAAYVESTKMEEGEWGKLPPLPTSWAAGILQLLKPVKGLYDLEKKTGGLGVSLFKTLAGDSSRRGFLKTIVGNSDKLRTKRILKKMTEDSKNYKSKFKWADTGPGSKFYKKLQEILNPTSPKGILKKAKADKKTFHAEGGIITVSDPGMGDGPFMMEEFLEAVKQGFKGTYDEYIDQIDRSPRDYLAEGGVIEEVWDKKGIEDAKESLEGMRPHLMEESYIQLLDFLDSKQKELDMDIMEDAGGLGEMLGEGGVAGHSPLAREQLPSQRRKKHISHKFPKLGEGGRAGFQGGDLVEKWRIIRDLYDQVGGQEGTGMSIEEFALKYEMKAKGGRVGMMYGGDPGFAFSYGGSWADWKDNHASEMPLMDYINQKLPKARHPFSDSKYNSGGPVHHLDGLALSIFQKPYAQLTSSQQSELDNFKPEAYEPIPKAEGGRIGLANGTTMDAFDSMTPNRQYMMTGESDVHRIQPPMGGILPLAGAGIFALSQKDKDKKTPQKKEGPNYPEPPEGGRIGLLRTGIMEAFEHLTRRYGDDLGEWAGKLGDVRKFFTQVAPDKVDEIVKSYGQNRKIDLSKKIKEFLNDKIKRYKSGLEDIKKYGQHAPVKEVGDHAEELKWLIKETKKDIKAIDQYGLLKQSQKATKHAEGGRIGMAGGMSAKRIDSKKRENYFRFNRDNYMNLFEYLQSEQAERDLEGAFKKGGRVGFQDGTGIMSQTGIPYYADKAVEGIVNSAETLSKLPFAGGKLISDLLRQKPNKKMFSEALENITPGSWSENLGISSLAEAEGAKVSDKQRAVGDILGLGTEMAVPVGVAFKTGQNLINQASKSMGKLKKGKTLDQTIDDKITDFGQSRRDFNILAGTSGLMVALKAIGLGGLLKGASKGKDIKVTYNTGINEPYHFDEIASQASWYDFEALTPNGINILKKLFGKDGVKTTKDPSGKLTRYVERVDFDEAPSWVDDIKKAGGEMELEHVDEYGSYGKVWKETDKFTDKDKFLNVSSIDSGYGLYDDSISDVYDTIYGTSKIKFGGDLVKKAEGGSVGQPPIQLGPLDLTPRASGGFTEGQPYGPDTREKTWSDNVGISGMLDLPGGFSLTGEYDKYRTKDRLYTADDEYLDERVRDDHDRWKLGLQWKKKFAKGGKAWRPKSAPKLTTTIPPERGPTPQGLTYLTGDDIVQNIG